MSDDPANALFADEEPRRTRPGTLAAVLAVVAVGVSLYGLVAHRSLNARLDAVAAQARELATAQQALGESLQALDTRDSESDSAVRRQLESVLSLARDVAALEATTADLQDRMTLPQRSWARAEALALLTLAQRQLDADRNVDAALETMTLADGRLAQLREPALSTVRRQLSADMEALRAFPQPDLDRVTAQLRTAEADVAALATAALPVEEAVAPPPPASEGPMARAWRLAKQALASVITVRSTAVGADALLTQEEQQLRRQRLQLFLLEARLALARADQPAFAAAIGEARSWLDAHFAAADPAVARLAAALAGLGAVDIAPPLPDVSASRSLLEQMVPITRSGP